METEASGSLYDLPRSSSVLRKVSSSWDSRLCWRERENIYTKTINQNALNAPNRYHMSVLFQAQEAATA